jgi:MFS family permease
MSESAIERPVELEKKGSLAAVFLTLFLDILGFSMVLPFLAEEVRRIFHASEFVGSLLASVYSLMQFLFVPLWGRVSDKVGRRPVLLWSVFATILGNGGLFLAVIYAKHVAWLFIPRVLSGIATANIGTASAYIADTTSQATRARGMALIGVAFGLAFILGPFLGGYFAETWLLNGRVGALPLLLSTIFAVVNFLWVLFGLPESLPASLRGQARPFRLGLDLSTTREVLARPGLSSAIIVNFILLLSFTVLDQTFSFYNKDLFARSAKQTGVIFGFIGVCVALVQGGIVRRLSGKVSEGAMTRWGLAFQAIGFGGLVGAAWVGGWFVYVGGALLALGNGLTQPALSAYISKRAGAHEQGTVLGTSQGLASLARTLGPGLGGALYTAVSPTFPYQASALGMLLALFLARGMDREPLADSTA